MLASVKGETSLDSDGSVPVDWLDMDARHRERRDKETFEPTSGKPPILDMDARPRERRDFKVVGTLGSWGC